MTRLRTITQNRLDTNICVPPVEGRGEWNQVNNDDDDTTVKDNIVDVNDDSDEVRDVITQTRRSRASNLAAQL